MKHGWTFGLVLLLGCSSLTPERIQTLAAIAGQAAALGASAWLAEHPEYRPAFLNAIAELGAVLATTNNAPQTLEDAAVEFLNKIPVSTLKGKDGELYVTGAELVVWDAGLKKGVSVEGAATEPVVRRIYSGLRRATAPKPPALPKLKGGFAPESAGGAVSNALALEGRTMRVRSEVDVLPDKVVVRWVLTPNSLYSIERKAGERWIKAGSLTNRAGTGVTNWSMRVDSPLPESFAAEWRVMRTR